MAYRNLARKSGSFQGPTAPRKSHLRRENNLTSAVEELSYTSSKSTYHPLTNIHENEKLYLYESKVKNRFDLIVPFLKKISAIQFERDFIPKAQDILNTDFGFKFPEHLLEKAWVRSLDMRSLFAWCVFKTYQEFSDNFFENDPLIGSKNTKQHNDFNKFLLDCGFHLLDITPCSDGRLAHSIAYALRIPFSAVRRRSHAGAIFDIEKNVNRWVNTEHRRYRESIPNKVSSQTNYLKVVIYHYSSVDPSKQGCAAHGSNDYLAAKSGLQRLLDYREAIENSFCCGASVDLLLLGMDTDTDAIRIHPPLKNLGIDIDHSISALEIYEETKNMPSSRIEEMINQKIEDYGNNGIELGMRKFVAKLIINNISQIDYVRQFHNGAYSDFGHAERFIGVGIGFKEVHLRNLTYFAHLDTVEKGSPDLDVGIKIFKGLNISGDLPIPIVIRFDYSGGVPGAKQRAISDCKRVQEAIISRYSDLVSDGYLHTFMTIRDRDQKVPAESVGSSLDPSSQEDH